MINIEEERQIIEDIYRPGTKWKHNSGIIYTILHIANIATRNEKYPVSIVYQGDNGNVWVKTIDDFTDTFKQYKVPISKFSSSAVYSDKKEYLCDYCQSPVFSNEVAVWCSKNIKEGGNCEFELWSG